VGKLSLILTEGLKAHRSLDFYFLYSSFYFLDWNFKKIVAAAQEVRLIFLPSGGNLNKLTDQDEVTLSCRLQSPDAGLNGDR
jgi:hypothetical protein